MNHHSLVGGIQDRDFSTTATGVRDSSGIRNAVEEIENALESLGTNMEEMDRRTGAIRLITPTATREANPKERATVSAFEERLFEIKGRITYTNEYLLRLLAELRI